MQCTTFGVMLLLIEIVSNTRYTGCNVKIIYHYLVILKFYYILLWTLLLVHDDVWPAGTIH
jgi:hypothetical protein